jgi:putative transposase
VGSVRRELLERILIVNERHLRKVLTEYEADFNMRRPHRALDQASPADLRSIRRKPVVAEVISEYHHAA